MALTVAECEAINAAVAKAEVKFQIGFMRRFDEGFMRAKETLASGEMGKVMIIKSTGRGPGGPGRGCMIFARVTVSWPR
jgi:myo-inositol 2-dehydrogenase/D-chiro-inositol 1-dehydrogenase/scyllo-inositol 2-dehydrogenase (NAD+)